MASSFIREYSYGLTVSAVGHGLLFLLLGMNLILMPDRAMQPVQLAIEATVIDTSAIRALEEEERQRQQALERQRQQAEEQRRKEEEARIAEQRNQQEAERRQAEEQRRKEEEARIAEQRRKEEAERQRQEAERQQAEERRRKEEEARIAEQRRKEEAERQRQEAEEARRQAEMQAQLQSELEAEEQRLAAINSGKLAQYEALIRSRVMRNWIRPASARPGIECIVHVRQIPGGEVVNVRVGQCNGDAAVIRSIEASVYRASPLPPPPDPSLFDQNLRITFKPEE